MSILRRSTSDAGGRTPPPGTGTALLQRLRGLGVSPAGASQVLGGQVVTSPSDRARIARVLANLLIVTPATANLEVYDWPGAYAQRFDGIDP